RNAKPFTAQEAFRAALVEMPPPPLPFAGALRAFLMERGGVEFAEYRAAARRPSREWSEEIARVFSRYGGPDDTGGLDLWGPFFVREGPDGAPEVLVKAPLDVQAVYSDRTKTGRTVPLVREADPPEGIRVASNPPRLGALRAPRTGAGETVKPSDDEEALEPGSGYLYSWDFGAYLRGESSALGPVREKDLWTLEPRTGIALKSTRTVKESHLYTAEFLRLRPGVGFCLRVDGGAEEELPASGMMRLGGEGRCAAFRRVDRGEGWHGLPPADDLVEPLSRSGRFRLVLLSPAVYRQGWLPDPVRESAGGYVLPLPGGGEARLIAAAVGKPRPIVGWDLAAGAPRPLLWAVPPGSVYWFDAGAPLGAERARELLDWLHLSKNTMEPWDECPPLYRQAGFGLTAVGSLGNES
ncbi:MAG: hypothetical protein D6708_08250, partial [Candidatus Dadabacteria bacterium]